MKKEQKRKKRRRRAVALLVLAALLFAVFYRGIVVRRYTVESGKLAAGQGFRLVVVADLHSHIYGGDQQPLLRRIRRQKPHAILLAGDIYDHRVEPEGVRLLLEGIRDLAPVYYVTGNHEYWVGDMGKVLGLFEQYGVTVLDDRWETADFNGVEVVVAGVNDPVKAQFETYDPEGALEQAFASLPQEPFSLLLAHRPTWIESYRRYPFDLVVSGHNHGGQVRIPFLCNGLVGPDEGLFPQYPGGVYRHGGLTQVVSRGLAVYWWLPRVCNPPELVVVDVQGAAGRG